MSNLHSRDGMLTGVIIVIFALSLIGIIYVALTPANTGNPYTEFSVLNANGSAGDYPSNLTVGETGTVTAVVTNHEGRDTSYQIVAKLNNQTVESHSITLEDGVTTKKPITFTPSERGNTMLYLYLYRDKQGPKTEPYRTLRLGISVTA